MMMGKMEGQMGRKTHLEDELDEGKREVMKRGWMKRKRERK